MRRAGFQPSLKGTVLGHSQYDARLSENGLRTIPSRQPTGPNRLPLRRQKEMVTQNDSHHLSLVSVACIPNVVKVCGLRIDVVAMSRQDRYDADVRHKT